MKYRVTSLVKQDRLLAWAAMRPEPLCFMWPLWNIYLALVFFFTFVFCGFPSGKHDGLTLRCQVAVLWPWISMWHFVEELKIREREIPAGGRRGEKSSSLKSHEWSPACYDFVAQLSKQMLWKECQAIDVLGFWCLKFFLVLGIPRPISLGSLWDWPRWNAAVLWFC